MDPLFLVIQTKSEATILILFLLLIAAIIGYVTAWLYTRSVYKRKIIVIESEKKEINTELSNVKNDNRDLQVSLSVKKKETGDLQKEINRLKAKQDEDIQKTIKLKTATEKKEQKEKDIALIEISKRKHLLDFESFGTATETEKDDLTMISGIGPFIEERLHALDIFTFRQISNFTATDIEKMDTAIEYFSGRIERDEWVSQAKDLVHNKDRHTELIKRISARKSDIYYNRIGVAKKEEADDLTLISGIGGWIESTLNALDIFTFKQISNFSEVDIQTVTDAIDFFPGRIERDEWVEQAAELVRIEGKKAELLKRISERKDKIYYDRFRYAHKHHANNLTLINGIGLWIEERLNMLDIYTFVQVSKFTAEDIETISEILEISPERIERKNWVGQARILAKTI